MGPTLKVPFSDAVGSTSALHFAFCQPALFVQTGSVTRARALAVGGTCQWNSERKRSALVVRRLVARCGSTLDLISALSTRVSASRFAAACSTPPYMETSNSCTVSCGGCHADFKDNSLASKRGEWTSANWPCNSAATRSSRDHQETLSLVNCSIS